MDTITYNKTLKVRTCWCGIDFALPSALERRYVDRDQETIFCPLRMCILYTDSHYEN